MGDGRWAMDDRYEFGGKEKPNEGSEEIDWVEGGRDGWTFNSEPKNLMIDQSN